MKALSYSDHPARDVAAVAEERLKTSPYYFLRRVTCHFAAGTLILRGRVPLPRLAALAEAIVADVDGVIDVVNRVEIGDPFSVDRAARNAG